MTRIETKRAGDDFKKARRELTEDTRKLISQWTKKDLEDFTEYLFRNRRKDRKAGIQEGH